jgi:hypothetical protein
MNQISLSATTLACIEQCRRCQLVCLHMATGHCLQKGGPHVEPEHLRTMLACAAVCGTAAEVMTTGASLHRHVCALCAEVCGICVDSCRGLDDMDECIAACESCRTSCEAMASR